MVVPVACYRPLRCQVFTLSEDVQIVSCVIAPASCCSESFMVSSVYDVQRCANGKLCACSSYVLQVSATAVSSYRRSAVALTNISLSVECFGQDEGEAFNPFLCLNSFSAYGQRHL